jgi:hypothetical protein
MTALTKAQLDAANAEWVAWRKEIGVPVTTQPPPPPSEPGISARDRALALGFAAGLAPTIHALEEKVAELSARVAELERSQKTYLGIWKADREYTPQSEVTHDGARWICHKRTTDRPGTSADWSMIEKSQPTANPRSDTTATTSAERVNGQHSNPRFR